MIFKLFWGAKAVGIAGIFFIFLDITFGKHQTLNQFHHATFLWSICTSCAQLAVGSTRGRRWLVRRWDPGQPWGNGNYVEPMYIIVEATRSERKGISSSLV